MRSNSLPPRAVCITLDDGYANNCEVALPILQRHAATATCFIATSFIGGGVMWNDAVIESIRRTRCLTLDLASAGLGRYALGSIEERRRAMDEVLEGLRYRRAPERTAAVAQVIEAAGIEMPRGEMLNAAQIRTLHAAGVEIGAHTVSHPILAGLDAVQARSEVEECRVQLGEIVRAPVRAFAYPNGRPGRDYHREHVEMVRAAGYQLAVSTAWGPVRGAADQWQMPRIAPWDRTLLRFGLRLIRTYCQRQVAKV
jgi:peptidoglycan/xylan/chitin deacetylase (PgdA/CDA1 family)